MSVWAYIEGTISVKINQHFSLKKACEEMKEIDDEFTYSISQTTDGNVIEFNFHGSVSRDGDDAVYFFNKFKEKLKGTIIHYDLTLTARFIQ